MKAKKVKVGDFLTGLDDGYVFEVSATEYDVEILFHDADGGENLLKVGPEHPLSVRRNGKER